MIRWSALCGVAVAAGVALLLWLGPQRSTPDVPLTPVQITEGIRQMMLLDIGEIESIVATPMGSYAILTASLTDGSSCSYILKCNDAEGRLGTAWTMVMDLTHPSVTYYSRRHFDKPFRFSFER